MNINLIGMRGVGKSNVARRLSVLSKRPVLSSDVMFEYEYGLSIPQFVDEHGGDWRSFRDAEFEILTRICALDDVIVDCGGGVIVDLDEHAEEVYSTRKVALLQAAGPVVWLKGDIARLAAKTAEDPSRPSLHAVHTAETIMRRREPLYERAADTTCLVEPGGRARVAESIARQFGIVAAER